MKTITLLLFVLLLGTRVSAQAGGPELDFAFSQLKGNGPGPFASSLYQDPDNAKQLAGRLNPLMQSAGEFNSYEIISRRPLAKRIERVTIVIYLEKFPIYMRIDSYDTNKGRIFLPASVSKDAAEILPFDLIASVGK